MNSRLILLLVIGYGLALAAGIDPLTAIESWITQELIGSFGL